ncbi:MAG: hypothetical protein LBM98_13705 [Oscillospiraceae bacterium]|nr:hypothetical protein [Oscillospiraceae bacterium]
MSNDTTVEYRLDRVEEDIKAMKQTRGGIFERINTLEKDYASTSATIATILSDLGEIKAGLKTLTEKPAKRWDNAVTQLISLVIAAIVGGLLSKFM